GPDSLSEPLVDRRGDFVDRDRAEAPVIGIAAAAALVVAIARLVPGDRHVFVAPGPVAFRIRGTEHRDGGYSDRRGNMKRTGIARQHDAGAPGNRHEIA